MPAQETVDEVVNTRAPSRGTSSRPMHEESVNASTGASKIDRSNVEDENHSGERRGRSLKKSTEDLLAKFEKEESDARAPAPHEEGDPDEEAPADADAPGDVSDADGSDEAAEVGADDAGDPGEADAAEGEGEEEEAKPDPVAEYQAAAARLEARNKELISELETARKTPRRERTERESALVAAEAAYIEKGSVPALREFLAVVVGAAPDSKEVDAELAGLYTDLTARELGVSLDQNQQALRDNARTRLLLARDRREKADAEKKPAVDNSADDVQYEQAAKHVENLKGQSGTSLLDEYPMMNALAEAYDGYKPSEVIARAVRRELMAGTLDPNLSDIDMIRTVAQKIETHYDALGRRIDAARAKTKKPDTTTSSGKPKVASVPSTEQRQSTGARTITNAAASRAPATNPKTTKPKAKTSTEKTRKDFPSDAAWKEHLLSKHFKS